MIFLLLYLLIFSINSSRNKVKDKLHSYESVYGGFVTIPSPKVIENLGMNGNLDFIWIEAEHSEFGPKEVQNLVRTCENVGTVPIVRVPINGIENIKRYIGSGTAGIIVPNIQSIDDAQEAIDSCKYFPIGKRHAGVERANGYLSNFQDYLQHANDDMLLGIMIETKEAVDQIEKLCNFDQIDFLHLGPYDLSLSLGVPMNSSVLSDAIAKVEKYAQMYKKPLGSAANTYNDTIDMINRGYRFFTIPGDMSFLQQGVVNWFPKRKRKK